MTNPISKKQLILNLVRRKSGASMTQLRNTTGWQPHSIRATLSGWRKRGHDIRRRQAKNGNTVYFLRRDKTDG